MKICIVYLLIKDNKMNKVKGMVCRLGGGLTWTIPPPPHCLYRYILIKYNSSFCMGNIINWNYLVKFIERSFDE